jgi:hypothetical protein
MQRHLLAEPMTSPEFSYEQLERLCFAALDAGDMEAVERAMTYMAIYYPHEAETIIETARLVQTMRGTGRQDGGA